MHIIDNHIPQCGLCLNDIILTAMMAEYIVTIQKGVKVAQPNYLIGQINNRSSRLHSGREMIRRFYTPNN